MPVLFRPDSNDDLRCSGWASLPYKSDDPVEHVIDDLGPDGLPDNPARLILSNHPGQDRRGRNVRGRPDDSQRHSRHMRASDVTLAEKAPPFAEDE